MHACKYACLIIRSQNKLQYIDRYAPLNLIRLASQYLSSNLVMIRSDKRPNTRTEINIVSKESRFISENACLFRLHEKSACGW